MLGCGGVAWAGRAAPGSGGAGFGALDDPTGRGWKRLVRAGRAVASGLRASALSGVARGGAGRGRWRLRAAGVGWAGQVGTRWGGGALAGGLDIPTGGGWVRRVGRPRSELGGPAWAGWASLASGGAGFGALDNPTGRARARLGAAGALSAGWLRRGCAAQGSTSQGFGLREGGRSVGRASGAGCGRWVEEIRAGNVGNCFPVFFCLCFPFIFLSLSVYLAFLFPFLLHFPALSPPRLLRSRPLPICSLLDLSLL